MISLLKNLVVDQEIRWWEHNVWKCNSENGKYLRKIKKKKKNPHIYKSELYLS